MASSSLVLAGCPLCGRALRLPPGGRGLCPGDCPGEIGPAHGPPALLDEGIAFCRWPSRWQTLRSWLRWVLLALGPWLGLVALLCLEPRVQRWLEPGSGATGVPFGPVFVALGEKVGLLWVGALVEHVPSAYGLGLLGTLAGLAALSGSLRRGKVRAPGALVWIPLVVGLVPILACLGFVAVHFRLRPSGRALSALSLPGTELQTGVTFVVLFGFALSLPLLAWRYGQKVLRTRYGAIEVTQAVAVVHQAGAWGSALRARPLDLELTSNAGYVFAKVRGASCGKAAQSQAAQEELRAAVETADASAPRPPHSRSCLSIPLAACFGLLSIFTTLRWGLVWVFPATGVATLLAAVLSSAAGRVGFEPANRFRRVSWWALGLWTMSLALLPTLPLESTFVRQDALSNRVVVTSRPGAPAYRVAFVSGAISAAAAGRIARASEGARGSAGATFWSTTSQTSGHPLSDLGGIWLWCQGSENVDDFWILSLWQERPLSTSLRDFLSGKSAKSLCHVWVDLPRSVEVFVLEGQVRALHWFDEETQRGRPNPRPGFSQIDPAPAFELVRQLSHDYRLDLARPEDWRSLAPLRARGFRTCQDSRIGWDAAQELLNSPWEALPMAFARKWGVRRRSPYDFLLRTTLAIRALQSLRDCQPERSPEITWAIATTRLRMKLARLEIRVQRFARPWRERGPRWLSLAAPKWLQDRRKGGWVWRQYAKRWPRKLRLKKRVR